MTRIDRRALFASGSAAALLAAVGVSAEARPARGGHLRAALSGGDRGESWLSVPGGRFLQAARNAVFEGLTEIAADGTLQPGLARSWQGDAGGRLWSFRLQEGVAFHDGRPLTPEDAAASLRAFGYAARAGSDLHVTLQTPDASFPVTLARGGHVVFSAAELAAGASLTNGTGLYRIRRFDAGQGFLGERVAAHRKDGQAGWFDTVELVSVTDARVRAEAVKRGIVDLADQDIAQDAALPDGARRVAGAVAAKTVQHPLKTAAQPLDDMRFATRWWMAQT